MASLFKQVQSTNSDEWLMYLKTLKYREKVKKQMATKMQWQNDARDFDEKLESRAKVESSYKRRQSPSPGSRAYYENMN